MYRIKHTSLIDSRTSSMSNSRNVRSTCTTSDKIQNYGLIRFTSNVDLRIEGNKEWWQCLFENEGIKLEVMSRLMSWSMKRKIRRSIWILANRKTKSIWWSIVGRNRPMSSIRLTGIRGNCGAWLAERKNVACFAIMLRIGFLSWRIKI